LGLGFSVGDWETSCLGLVLQFFDNVIGDPMSRFCGSNVLLETRV